jgi:hypothetical protein
MEAVITHSSRRINAFSERMRITRYLEVGVETGATFFGVKADEKIAVDPNFLFDEKAYASTRVSFVKQTSDDFFNTYTGAKFDFVYLDGLHLFEQILRDFTNSLVNSHANTIIMLDDIFPSDIYSSFRDWNETMALRKRLGSSSGDWHGDVYKMLFFINDFFPALSFATIDDSLSNRQLAVWKKQRASFTPIFNDVRRIAEATYADLLKHEKVCNLMSEDDVVNKVSSDLFGI